MKKFLIGMAAVLAAACTQAPASKDLPREAPSAALEAAFKTFQDSVAATITDPIDYMKMVNLHSIMVVKDGKVVLEHWYRDQTPDTPHIMYSVSKTFTSAAIGMLIREGKLSLDTPIAPFFPEYVREDNPCTATVRDLLMMAGGHDTDPTLKVVDFDYTGFKMNLKPGADLAEAYFSTPFVHAPGTYFWYDSLGTYLLSAILQQLTGQTVLEYLTPRLFEPLGIDIPVWDTDEKGICLGGWGLHLKTEDMAKMGLLLLQEGKWQGKQLIPAAYVKEMGHPQVACAPSGQTAEQADQALDPSLNDWRQGYGFQTWMNTREGFRADGAMGQYILVLPEKNAVVVMTAFQVDLQLQLNYVWKYLYPAL